MLLDAVQLAAGRADVRDAVARIYANLQQEIDLRRPKCSASGRCCRFDEFGHRLYVTTMELGAFVHGLQQLQGAPQAAGRSDGGGCRFQIDGLCSVHQIRPFGCRVFFCDETAQTWQEDQYARFHADLKQMHDALEVPYFYMEWRQALDAIGSILPLAVSRTDEAPMAHGVKPTSTNLSLRQLPL